MVEKMTKYSFILLDGETGSFLERLQQLGVMDITRSKKPVDANSASIMEKASDIKKAMSILKKADYSADPDREAIEAASVTAVCGTDYSAAASEASARLSELQERLTAATRAVKARLPWGQFSAKDISGLEEKGLKVHFYNVSKKAFDKSWEEMYPLQIISENGSNIWFVTVSDAKEEYSFPVNECQAPEGSYEDAEADAEAVRKEIIAQKGLLLKLRGHMDELQAEYDRQLTDLDFYLAEISGESAAENRLNIFIGFAPSYMDDNLKEELDKMDIFYMTEAATEEDNPPIKLKNNKFASMFEVLTGMYGMPVYREYDPTAVLAPFFLLFFALCLGDAGYGLVLVGVGAFLKKKVKSMAGYIKDYFFTLS